VDDRAAPDARANSLCLTPAELPAALQDATAAAERRIVRKH
jgi:hypothetical protein